MFGENEREKEEENEEEGDRDDKNSLIMYSGINSNNNRKN